MLKVACRYDYSNVTKSGTAECQTCFKQTNELFLTIDEKDNTFMVCGECLEHKKNN